MQTILLALIAGILLVKIGLEFLKDYEDDIVVGLIVAVIYLVIPSLVLGAIVFVVSLGLATLTSKFGLIF